MRGSFDLTIDARHPAALARFWAAVLPGYAVRPYDAAEIARLAARGLTPETDPSVALDGDGPTIWFQQVDATHPGLGRIHLDIKVVDREAEVRRLLHLGATLKVSRADHAVLLDPEENRFCVFGPAG